jgi:hypothetical protein
MRRDRHSPTWTRCPLNGDPRPGGGNGERPAVGSVLPEPGHRPPVRAGPGERCPLQRKYICGAPHPAAPAAGRRSRRPVPRSRSSARQRAHHGGRRLPPRRRHLIEHRRVEDHQGRASWRLCGQRWQVIDQIAAHERGGSAVASAAAARPDEGLEPREVRRIGDVKRVGVQAGPPHHLGRSSPSWPPRSRETRPGRRGNVRRRIAGSAAGWLAGACRARRAFRRRRRLQPTTARMWVICRAPRVRRTRRRSRRFTSSAGGSGPVPTRRHCDTSTTPGGSSSIPVNAT